MHGSPHKRKKLLFKDEAEEAKQQHTNSSTLGLPLSPSINFIDAGVSESQEEVRTEAGDKRPKKEEEDVEAVERAPTTEEEEKKVTNVCLNSAAENQLLHDDKHNDNKTNEATAAASDTDKRLVISAQVHRDPIPEARAAEMEQGEREKMGAQSHCCIIFLGM